MNKRWSTKKREERTEKRREGTRGEERERREVKRNKLTSYYL